MKVKVKKSELRECIKNAVIRAINESKKPVNEWVDDDDDDDPFAEKIKKNGYGRKKNGKWQGESEKNKYKRKDPKAAEARKAAMQDMKDSGDFDSDD